MAGRGRQKKNGSVWVIVIMLALIAAVVIGMIFLIQKKADDGAGRVAAGAENSGVGAADGLNEGSDGQDIDAQQLPDDMGSNLEAAAGPARYEFTIKADEQEITETGIEPETSEAKKPEITLAFAGDILFDPSYAIMSSLLGRSDPPDIADGIDEQLLSIMRDADICMVNNEFPYSDRGEPLAGKQYTFRARPEYARLMGDMGADVVSLANNHVNDYGLDAMLDTFDALDAAGIPYVGAGHDIAEASAPFYIEAEGVKLAILSATQIERLGNPDTVGAGENSPGTFRCLDDAMLLEKIAEAKAQADFVVVYVHWGTESTNVPDWLQLQQAPEIAEAGADLIIGDHPHVLQPISCVSADDRKVPVIYSLGNFLFNSSTIDTCLVQATIDTETKKLSQLKFIPAVQSGCRTAAAEGDAKKRILDFMQSISSDITLDEDGVIGY